MKYLHLGLGILVGILAVGLISRGFILAGIVLAAGAVLLVLTMRANEAARVANRARFADDYQSEAETLTLRATSKKANLKVTFYALGMLVALMGGVFLPLLGPI